MKRVIGLTDGVEIDETDELIYAKRKNRDTYTVFTKSRQPQPSRFVSVVLKRQVERTFELLSTWVGKYDSPPFPGDKNATPESIPYWSTHALVWGNQEVQSGTETTICPW